MTVIDGIRLSHGLYSMKGEEVARLIPAIYDNTIEEYKNDSRKCLLQILVPNISTAIMVDSYLRNLGTLYSISKSPREFRMVLEDYDIHITVNKDFTFKGIMEHFESKTENYITIAMFLYDKIDIAVEELLFERFVRGGKLFGMLVKN